MLQYPDFYKEFILTTDTSDVAIGAILSQRTIGQDKMIAYDILILEQPKSKLISNIYKKRKLNFNADALS